MSPHLLTDPVRRGSVSCTPSLTISLPLLLFHSYATPMPLLCRCCSPRSHLYLTVGAMCAVVWVDRKRKREEEEEEDEEEEETSENDVFDS